MVMARASVSAPVCTLENSQFFRPIVDFCRIDPFFHFALTTQKHDNLMKKSAEILISVDYSNAENWVSFSRNSTAERLEANIGTIWPDLPIRGKRSKV